MESPREKIARLALEQGKSLNSLSKDVGKASAYLSQYIGQKRSPKVLPEQVRHDLARLLGVNESELRERGAPQSRPMSDINNPNLGSPITTFSVPLIGNVQGGCWVSRDIAEEIKKKGQVVPGDQDYRDVPQFALKVIGDSVDNFIKDGDYAICVDINAGIDLEDGDYVVVETRRHGGSEIETTIKRLRLTSNGPELWPDSTNPKYDAPVFLDKSGDDVQVKGLVLRQMGKTRPRRPKSLKL